MRYTRRSIGRILMYSFSSYGLLLGVFAVEKFQFILTVAVQQKMNAPEFFMLLVSFLPTVVDFIIPIATLVTVYFVVLQNRENREYLVFAAAGLGRKPILQTTSVLALFVFALSLSVSGYLKPLASFNFRTAYERALEQVMERGPMGGRFFEQDGMVLHVSDNDTTGDTTGQRRMKAFAFQNGRLKTIYASDCASMRVQSGQLISDVCKLKAYAFRADAVTATASPCRICPDQQGHLAIVKIGSGRSEIVFSMPELFPETLRNRLIEQKFSALFLHENGQFSSQEQQDFGLRKIMMALVASFSVVVAVVAVAMTSTTRKHVTLLLAIAGVTVLTAGAGSGNLHPDLGRDTGLFIAFVGAAVCLVAASLPLVVLVFQQRLIRPALGRT